MFKTNSILIFYLSINYYSQLVDFFIVNLNFAVMKIWYYQYAYIFFYLKNASINVLGKFSNLIYYFSYKALIEILIKNTNKYYFLI